LAAVAASVRINAPAAGAFAGSGRPELAVVRLDLMARTDGTRDRLELLDPTPLFMPGRESFAGAAPASLGEQSGGRAGKLFPPVFSFSERGASRALLFPAPPSSILEVMEVVTAPRIIEGLSRTESPSVELVPKARAARFEIYRGDDAAATVAVDVDNLPASGSAGWRPMELSLLVTPGGMIARPSIVGGSGSDETDRMIRAFVTDELLLKVNLRPGIYRILVGP
jgi:hypothetical protein